MTLALLGDRLVDEPDGPFLQLGWIVPLGHAQAGGALSFWDGSIILQGREPPPKSVRFT